jgi:hypothetical protein
VKSSSPRIAFGHFRHHFAGSGQFGDFVNALDLNRRGVHIHHQQPRRAQMRNFPQRRDIQPRFVRQPGCPQRQRARQTNNLIIFDNPGGNDNQRRTQLTLPGRQPAFIKAASVEQPAAASGMIIQRHDLITAQRKR